MQVGLALSVKEFPKSLPYHRNTKTGLELIDCILFSLWKFWTPVSPSYSSILHSKTIRQQNVLSKKSQRFFSGNFKLQQTRGRSCVEVQLPVGFPYPPFSVNFNCFQVLCFPTFKFSSIEWKALLFSISLKRVFQIKFCNFDSTTNVQPANCLGLPLISLKHKYVFPSLFWKILELKYILFVNKRKVSCINRIINVNCSRRPKLLEKIKIKVSH